MKICFIGNSGQSHENILLTEVSYEINFFV